MKKTLSALLLTITLLTTGCMQTPEKNLTYDTPEKFELTTTAQDAVFYVSFGWVGGPAGYPVFDLKTQKPREFKGEWIYIDYKGADEIEKTLRGAESYPEIVKVSANIELKPGKMDSVMLPPGPDGGFREDIYGYTSAKINKLYNVLPVDKFGRKPKE